MGAAEPATLKTGDGLGDRDAADEFTYSGEELDSLGEARNYYAWISSRFAPYLGARMVEVGAGIGTFLAHLLALRPDARVTAIEPADNNFPHLARRFAGDARTYDRWVVPVVRFLEDRIEPPVGNALLAVARKTVENEG